MRTSILFFALLLAIGASAQSGTTPAAPVSYGGCDFICRNPAPWVIYSNYCPAGTYCNPADPNGCGNCTTAEEGNICGGTCVGQTGQLSPTGMSTQGQ
jgi:hypothetical protein